MARDKLRINDEITAPEVSVINLDGNKRDDMPTVEALRLARERGLDLVEVDPEAHPPACKMLNVRQVKYETAKARVWARYPRVELEIRDNQIKQKK
jgi:translation initiation factor IF-3